MKTWKKSEIITAFKVFFSRSSWGRVEEQEEKLVEYLEGLKKEDFNKSDIYSFMRSFVTSEFSYKLAPRVIELLEED